MKKEKTKGKRDQILQSIVNPIEAVEDSSYATYLWNLAQNVKSETIRWRAGKAGINPKNAMAKESIRKAVQELNAAGLKTLVKGIDHLPESRQAPDKELFLFIKKQCEERLESLEGE